MNRSGQRTGGTDRRHDAASCPQRLINGQRRILCRFFRRPAEVPDPDSSAFNLYSSLRLNLNGLGVNPMFFLHYPCREAFGVILIVHRNNGLDDDRPRIHPFIGKMDGTS